MRYQVLVENFGGLKTAADGVRQYINAELKAEASILDLGMEAWRTVKVTIPSEFDLKSGLTEVSDTTIPAQDAADAAQRQARAEDLNATVQVASGNATSFPAEMRTDLGAMLGAHQGNWVSTREFLTGATDVGPATASALQHAFQLTASDYDGATVQLSNPVEKRLVTLAAGDWTRIKAELAAKAAGG